MDAERIESIADAVKAVVEGEIAALTAALKSGVVTAQDVDESGCTLLHWAALNNRCEIASVLINKGADVNSCGGVLGETPLMWALRRRYYAMASLLYSNGADISIKNKVDGSDALHNAVKVNLDIHAVFLLLYWGADSNSLDSKGDTPLTWIVDNRQGPHGLEIVRLLCKFDTSEEMGDKEADERAAVKDDKEQLLKMVQNHTDENGRQVGAGVNNMTDLDKMMTDEKGERDDRDMTQYVPSSSSVFNGRREDGNTPLHLFSLNHSVDPLMLFEIHQCPAVTPWVDKDNQRSYKAKKNKDGFVPYNLAVYLQQKMVADVLFDAVFFNKLPYETPTAVVVSLSLLLYFLLGSIPFYFAIPVWFFLETVAIRWGAQWNLLTHRDRVMVGLSISSWLLILIDHWQHIMSGTGFIKNVLTMFSFVAVLLVSIKLSYTKPVSLHSASRQELSDEIIRAAPAEGPDAAEEIKAKRRAAFGAEKAAGGEGALEEHDTGDKVKSEGKEPNERSLGPKLCSACVVDRRLASNHCESCDRCTVGMSMHFQFLGVCIGQGNRRLFMGFCFTTMISMWLYLSSAYNVHTSEEYCGPTEVSLEHWFGWYQVLVSWCVFYNHMQLALPFTLALGILGYMLMLLNVECNTVQRDTTFFMVQKGMFDLEQHQSAQWSKLGDFIKSGGFHVRFREASVFHSGGGTCQPCNVQYLRKSFVPVRKGNRQNREEFESLVGAGDSGSGGRRKGPAPARLSDKLSNWGYDDDEEEDDDDAQDVEGGRSSSGSAFSAFTHGAYDGLSDYQRTQIDLFQTCHERGNEMLEGSREAHRQKAEWEATNNIMMMPTGQKGQFVPNPDYNPDAGAGHDHSHGHSHGHSHEHGKQCCGSDRKAPKKDMSQLETVADSMGR